MKTYMNSRVENQAPSFDCPEPTCWFSSSLEVNHFEERRRHDVHAREHALIAVGRAKYVGKYMKNS